MSNSQRILIYKELRKQRLNTIARSLGREKVKDFNLKIDLYFADNDNYTTDSELAMRFLKI